MPVPGGYKMETGAEVCNEYSNFVVVYRISGKINKTDNIMKQIISMAVCLLCALRMAAVPADPTPVTVTQPDGSQLTISLHGDEFYHFTTTADGYTVVRSQAGGYTYAALDGSGRIVPSAIAAHNPGQRTAAERTMLGKTGKFLQSTAAVADSRARRARAQGGSRIKPIDYNAFRGLVVLVNFKGKKFMRSDAADFYNKMLNQPNYKGYVNEDGSENPYGKYTGSVRDYYYDNSMGKFSPHFDVVGPVEVDYDSTDMHSSGAEARSILAEAVGKLGSTVNLADYDTDGDGVVDMVYFIVAGHGANVSGNDANLLWPHKWQFVNQRQRGVWLGLYACSTEMQGSQTTAILDGIGTICHEFSHVLGLPDLYDTNYEVEGQSNDPGPWDVMASGSYLNRSRTPCGYSAWERYTLGFMNPKRIDADQSYTLNPLNTDNEAYILPTLDSREFFMLENRQRHEWDAYLPWHGMIVARVDSTEEWGNRVNTDPSHNHYELLRAGGSHRGTFTGDPFPGTAGVRTITSFTSPSLCQWNGAQNPRAITGIAENDGVITFNAQRTSDLTMYVETFEQMAAGAKGTGVKGAFSDIDFTRCSVAEPDSAVCHGKKAVAMAVPSAIAFSTPKSYNAYLVAASVFNPSQNAAKFMLEYMAEGDSVWTRNPNSIEVGANSEAQLRWYLSQQGQQKLRIMKVAGSQKVNTYLDDIMVYGTVPAGVEAISAASAKSGFAASARGLDVQVIGAAAGSRVALYAISGAVVATATADPSGRATMHAPARGFYVVASHGHAVKVRL